MTATLLGLKLNSIFTYSKKNRRDLERFFTSSTRGRYFLSLTRKVFLALNWEGIP